MKVSILIILQFWIGKIGSTCLLSWEYSQNLTCWGNSLIRDGACHTWSAVMQENQTIWTWELTIQATRSLHCEKLVMVGPHSICQVACYDSDLASVV